MSVIIKKNHAPKPREIVPVLPASPVPSVFDPSRWWEAYGLPPNPPIKICAYCKQAYYIPCDAERHGGCQNFLHQQESARLG